MGTSDSKTGKGKYYWCIVKNHLGLTKAVTFYLASNQPVGNAQQCVSADMPTGMPVFVIRYSRSCQPLMSTLLYDIRNVPSCHNMTDINSGIL